MQNADFRVWINVSLPSSLTCLPVNDVTNSWNDRTYIHAATTYQILDIIFLCVHSKPDLWLPLWSMLLNPKYNMRWSCEKSAEFLPRVCARYWTRSPARCGGARAGGPHTRLPPWGCKTPSGSAQNRVREGPHANTGYVLQSCLKLLLVSHILPFFRLAAIIFFFCKIFCKQQQKAIIKKKGGQNAGITIRKPIAPLPAPCYHLATCCWHEVGANDLFVQRYIFYEEFVKLLNML